MTSTAVPAMAEHHDRAKCRIVRNPAMSSRALGRTIMGWIVTPAMRASGLAALALAMISYAALWTAITLTRFNLTPPTSDL